MEKLVVNNELVNVRLDKALTTILEGKSRSYIAKMIEENKVLVNSKVEKQSYKLKENSTSGSFQINDIKMSTIEYETINMQGTVEKRLTKKIINNQNDEASTQEFVNYDIALQSD